MRLKINILVLVTLFMVVCTAFGGQTTPTQTLKVYYFHRTVRCPSCLLLEELTNQAVNEAFGPEVKKGRIEVSIINIDVPAHAHFEKDYALEFQSVVLSSLENGKETSWKNLPLIWDYLEDEGKFISYIRDEIRARIK